MNKRSQRRIDKAIGLNTEKKNAKQSVRRLKSICITPPQVPRHTHQSERVTRLCACVCVPCVKRQPRNDPCHRKHVFGRL